VSHVLFNPTTDNYELHFDQPGEAERFLGMLKYSGLLDDLNTKKEPAKEKQT
jgi:hypothetical protein